MFARLLALLGAGPEPPSEDSGPDALQRAAALLLVIAARLDGAVAGAERRTIVDLLRTRLDVEDAEDLVVEVDREAVEATDLYGVTRIINDRLAVDHRHRIIELLWEVAYADGEVHDYEANLVRRVTGLLHVSDRDAGEARRRVLIRLGIAG